MSRTHLLGDFGGIHGGGNIVHRVVLYKKRLRRFIQLDGFEDAGIFAKGVVASLKGDEKKVRIVAHRRK